MVQLETVEKTIDEQQKELNRLNAQATQQAEAFSQMKQDMENRLEKVQSLGDLKDHVSSRGIVYYITASLHIFQMNILVEYLEFLLEF